MCSLSPGDQSLSCVFWSSLQVAEKKKEFDVCPLATFKKIFNKLLSVNIFIKGYIRSDDGNENVKKAIGLMGKTATLQVLHAFCVHFFAVTAVHDYDVNMPTWRT